MLKIENSVKSARTVVFELETLYLIEQSMQKWKINFSKAVNRLIKSADYLITKMELMKKEEAMNANKERDTKS